MLKRSRVPNALLFWGPGGVGKRTAAMEFAKAINCKQVEADACDACLSCRKIANLNHPDVRVFVPADKSREIKKKDIDEVNELASLRPFESRWRVVVLQDADRMNAYAQNHFLKTLEEPPGRSVFILLTEYPRVLLPTIRSRCQMVRFSALRPETVVDLLQALRDLPEDLARSIAGIAEGQMSRALDLVDSDKRELVFGVLSQLAEGDDPIQLADEFSKYLADLRKQTEVSVKAELDVDSIAGGSTEDVQRLKEERLALLSAAIKRDILEHLFLMETWYRDELVYGALGNTDRVWNRDHVPRLQGALSSDPGSKILAIERARTYLDRFIPEDRVFRDLFLALAEP
jgi:DNA polymerase-3 subunit delta'